jgi:hypothetical protein
VRATIGFVLVAACGREPAARATVDSANASVAEASSIVVTALSTHDMTRVAQVVHPTRGVRFSPYAHVDTLLDRVVPRTEMAALWTDPTISVWGTHDGSGEPIRLNYAEYHKSFVYDADFVSASKVAIDAEPMGRGTIINNVAASYPGASIVEYHVPGRDPKLNGMDWRSLWLVFDRQGGSWYLVGVVHGAWTI